MGVSGQGVQAKDESESKYPGIEAQVAGQGGREGFSNIARQSIRNLQRSQFKHSWAAL